MGCKLTHLAARAERRDDGCRMCRSEMIRKAAAQEKKPLVLIMS
jgi:hypothetical protein